MTTENSEYAKRLQDIYERIGAVQEDLASDLNDVELDDILGEARDKVVAALRIVVNA